MVETNVYTVRFEGNAITATVTSSGEAVERWVDEVLSVHRPRLHKLVVGLDVEWRPSYGPEYSPTALLQLCVGRRCLILQLLHADYIPDALVHVKSEASMVEAPSPNSVQFLGDADYRFVGVGVGADAERLSYDHDYLEVANTVDLREVAAEEMNRPDLRHAGLKDIASAVMGANVEKPRRVTMGRWDDYYLSNEQIEYACIDAFVSFEIGRMLLPDDHY
ncbi:hypothetical protein BAE44_0005876 [Dichanthelium oligosanthes]|uniref:3'-5' exonuclease domain-containing protein n=1 Tax=Dichanthelium oligosanthes TaxID=888268 RepID=A0A1E5W7B0_9POAL|nr:hypothetical protein BAE44_0005876 [Dichanthelium oligosanthes]